MAGPLRFFLWFVAALAVSFGIDALGQFITASPLKPALLLTAQGGVSLALAWLFGLIRFATKVEVAVSAVVFVLALAIQFIVMVIGNAPSWIVVVGITALTISMSWFH